MARVTDDTSGSPGGADETSINDRLVRAAAEEFAERGYEGARIQHIARRAGLSTGAIYNRYDGKVDLLREAIRVHSPGEVDALQRAVAEEGSLPDLLERFGRSLPTGAPSTRSRLLLEAIVASQRDPEVAGVVREKLVSTAEARAEVVREGIANGDLDDDLDAAAFLRFSQALGLGFLLTDAVGLPEVDADAWDDLVGRIIDSLRRPHAPTDRS